MHYAYFLFAVMFCLVSIAMTVVSAIRYFEVEKKDDKDISGFLMIFLLTMSAY